MSREVLTGETQIRGALASSLADVHFTPVEKRILHLLADGQPHLIDDVVKCLGDELATRQNLANHMSNIRAKIVGRHHDIICQFARRRLYYRYVLSISFLTE